MHDPDTDTDVDDTNSYTTPADVFGDDDADDESSPFDDGEDFGDGVGSDGGDGGDDDVFEIPPEPIGVLQGFVKGAKRWANDKAKIIITIQISEPPFAKSSPIEVWYNTANGNELRGLMRFAAAIGAVIRKEGNVLRFPGGVPNAFKDKTGRFIIATWDKKDGSSDVQLAKYGAKPGTSAAWDEHMAELAKAGESYTDEQLKTLKSSPGVVPSDF